MPEKTTIGIFGGSFNPVHNGHLELIQRLPTVLNLTRLFVVPCKMNPLKDALDLDAELRFRMLKVATQALPGVEVSRFEIDQEGPSYSIKTIEYFKGELFKLDHQAALDAPNRIHFILGEDAFIGLEKWHRFEQLKTACTWVIITRKSVQRTANVQAMDELLKKHPEIKAIKLGLDLPDLSSTMIRDRMKKGLDLTGFVPEKAILELKHGN